MIKYLISERFSTLLAVSYYLCILLRLIQYLASLENIAKCEPKVKTMSPHVFLDRIIYYF